MYQFLMTSPPPTVDYIQIRSESNGGGEVVMDKVYNLDNTDTFYAAGYNFTSGYIDDVEVSWSITNPDFVINPNVGINTNFASDFEGTGTLVAVYNFFIQNATSITISVSQNPQIAGTIPDIELEEDFILNLANFELIASDPQDSIDDLKWFITGVDSSIITIPENERGNHIIQFVSINDKFGNMEVIYWLEDSEGNLDSQKAWINITPKNDPPSISGCPNLVVHYDMPYSFDYSTYVKDIDNVPSDLTLSCSDTDYTTISGFTVTYNYPLDMIGDRLVILTVSDGEFEGYTLIKVTIASNRPPSIIANLPDVTLFESEISEALFDLDNYFDDLDGDDPTFSVREGNVEITINSDNTVDFVAPNDWSGTEQVTFRAADIIGGIKEQTVNISVIPVNDPPVIDAIDQLNIRYNYTYILYLEWYISDRDNTFEELMITPSNPDNVTVIGPHLFLLYPEMWEGEPHPYTTTLEIWVSDGFYNVSQNVTINVSDNYPPGVLTPLDDLSMFEDHDLIGVYDLDNHFFDLDGDTIYYTYGNEHIDVIIHQNNNTIDFIPPSDWFGSETILIRATDEDEAFLEDVILVTVIPVNDPPVIGEIPAQKGEHETEWVLDLTEFISDIDNDQADLRVSVNSSYIEVRGQVIVFNYPKDISKDTIWITVNDGELNTTVSVPVTVTTPTSPTPEVPWILLIVTVVLAVLLSGALIARIARYKLEELFLITKSGMLIEHKGIHMDEEKDKDILASMFVAVQSFIKDAFAEEDTEALKRMDYGDKTVLIHMGNYVLLTAFITGQESKIFLKDVKEFIDHLEKRYEGAIEQWNGNYDNLPDIDKLLGSFFDGTFRKEFLKPFNNNIKEETPKEKGDSEA
jgi:hypothetical protein